MRMLHLLGAITAPCLAAACSTAQGIETKPPRPVKVEAVTMAAAQTSVRYSASVEPYEQVTLAFKASGYVDDLLQRKGADGRSRAVQAGDVVTKGAVLARVRESDYRERVDQGRARLQEAEAALKKARLDLDRAEILFAADSLTKTDLDAAQASHDSARARVASARSDIELATSALGDCTLVSPSTGVLLERRIEVGSLVGSGTAGFVFGDLSSVKARFGIPDAVIQSVHLGDSIGVTVEALEATAFSGRVTAIAPTADRQSRVFDVEITIPNRDGRLRPGMIGTVAIGQAPDQTAAAAPLVLPLAAVVRAADDAKQYAVLVVELQGNREVARARRVTLGDVVGNGVTVVKGVASGDRVITTGATLLTDGDPVRVIP